MESFVAIAAGPIAQSVAIGFRRLITSYCTALHHFLNLGCVHWPLRPAASMLLRSAARRAPRWVRSFAVCQSEKWSLRSGCGSSAAGFASKAKSDSDNTAAAPTTSSSSSAAAPSASTTASSSSSAAPAPNTRSMTRAAYQRAASLLSRPAASATPSSSSSSPSSSAPSRRPLSLSVPLRAGSDVVDPMVAYEVERYTEDNILEEQLLDTTEKLVLTKTELAAALTREKREQLQLREALRRSSRQATQRQSGAREATIAPGEQYEQLVDHIDVQSENEQLELTNPESMRRKAAIELKRVRISIREQLFDIEERSEQMQEQQFKDSEKERLEKEDKQRRLESGEEDLKQANADYFDPMRHVREEEARLALEAARLRENAVFRYRQEYGEREGDDYALPAEEEERLYEKDDQQVPMQARPAQMRSRVRPRIVDPQGRSFGKGGRKSSHALVWIKPGSGLCKVNGQLHSTYFTRWADRAAFVRPFEAVHRLGLYDVVAVVSGGGKTGQSGAVQLGVARALARQEPMLRDRLKEEGFLTRDARKVERKKPGRPKARKRYTFVKR